MNILEVENDSITLDKHLMNEIPLLVDLKTLVALCHISIKAVDVEIIFSVLCVYLIQDLLTLA